MQLWWPFILYGIYALIVEVFMNLRLNKLQHAIRATILANTKSFDQGNQVFKQYENNSVKNLLKPIPSNSPKYLLTALNQRRRTGGLRLVLHAIGLVSVFVAIALI
ncbi:MAG: hypothetical protein ACPGLV_07345 [Bacteroidia bacterium]